MVMFGGVAIMSGALHPPVELAGGAMFGHGNDVVHITLVGRHITDTRVRTATVSDLNRSA
jgi:hypothetical protein